jgi:hypothetical protein
MIKTIEISRNEKPSSEKVGPTFQAWKGANMVRVHSLRASIKEVLQVSDSLDAISIGIIGSPGTGKTTLMYTLAHLIHKMAMDIYHLPFAVKIFDKHNLLNFQETLKGLTPTNYILGFDDVSFLGANATKKQIEIVKQATTEIRHLPGGQDVKIIKIMNYHYTLGVDKYLRQADFRYFTSVGSSELENMEKIVGSKYTERVKEFQKVFSSAVSRKKFFYKLKGHKGFFAYDYRHPFIPLLFFNNNTLRHVVSPTREWIDPICTICARALSDENMESEVPIEEFKKQGFAKFGPGTFKAAVKLKLFQNGVNVYANKVVQASRWLDKCLEKKVINLEVLAQNLGLNMTRTRLNQKLDGLFDDSKTLEQQDKEETR